MTSQQPSFWYHRVNHTEWLAATRGLTAAERGIFDTLINMMMEKEAPLEASLPRLRRLCAAATTAALEKALEALENDDLITRRDGEIWSPWAQREMEYRQAVTTKKKDAANARWGNTEHGSRHPTRGRKCKKNNAAGMHVHDKDIEIDSNTDFPPTPQGGREEDFPLIKIYSSDPAFLRWIDHWLTTGEERRAQQARDQGWLATASKWPPEEPSQKASMSGAR